MYLMMRSFVALDLETTGLDARQHEIIEIAAVRFEGGRIVARWAELIKPRQPIPAHITRITGIDNGMVANAPRIHQVVDALQAFVGDSLLVGHNLHKFDLPFLHMQGLFRRHPIADTLRAAEVLLPRAPDFSLGTLAHYLHLPQTPAHRALQDAETTGWLFLALCEKAAELPENLLRLLLRWAQRVHWPAAVVLQEGLRRHRGPKTRPLGWTGRDEPMTSPSPPVERLPHPLESGALLGPEGPLARVFPGYEVRESQMHMAEAVAEALLREEHLMVEAGTGTGKSLAYLVPAALWALRHQEPVVVSTYTKVLQDQLLHKDIPLVQKMLGDVGLRAVVLKGRGNYLCPRRLEDRLREGPRDESEFQVLGRTLVWLVEGGTGEQDDLTLRGHEMWVWRQINAEDEGCTAKTCTQRMGGQCPFYRARRAAHEAHLVIVNHALLMADAVGGFRVLPEFSRLVLDEAHHLERAATEALTQEFSPGTWRGFLRELGHRQKGLLGRIAFLFQQHASPDYQVRVRGWIQHAVDAAFQFQEELKILEALFQDYLDQTHPHRERYRYALRIRMTPHFYHQPWWKQVEREWLRVRTYLETLHDRLEQLALLVHRLYQQLEDPELQEALEDVHGRLLTLDQRALEVREHLQAFFLEGELRWDAEVHWLEWDPKRKQMAWVRAPRRVDHLLQESLWEKKPAAVLTSATLTVAGSFAFMQERLGMFQARTLLLPSPFDYENQALMYVVRNVPRPNGPEYTEVLSTALVELARATQGRMLVLFTSYAQMDAVARRIRSALEAAGIRLLLQEEKRSVQSLVRAFRAGGPAVLLGTRSLWEGIDIPGQDLSVLVLTKLPFGVPDDPLHAARAEMYPDPFTQYSLPDAVLAFRQGFGRLIRTRTDRGLVVVFDSRLIHRRYGQVFLRSLPACRVYQGPWESLPDLAAQWLDAAAVPAEV